MNKPVHDILHTVPDRAGRNYGAVDQDHRQTQFPRSIQLGLRTRASGIFGNNMGNAVLAQQGQVFGQSKRTTRNYGLHMGQRQRGLWPVHQTQQVEMLGLTTENAQCLAADCQEHARRMVGQSLYGRLGVGHKRPFITHTNSPWGPLQCAQGHACHGAGGHSVCTHPRSKRMCRVYDMGNVFGPQISHQPGNTAKPANPCRQGLDDRGCRTARIGKNGTGPGIRQNTRRLRGLTCSAKQKDTRRV